MIPVNEPSPRRKKRLPMSLIVSGQAGFPLQANILNASRKNGPHIAAVGMVLPSTTGLWP